MKKCILLLIAILFISGLVAYFLDINYIYFAKNYGLKCSTFENNDKKIKYCMALLNKEKKEPFSLLLVLHSGREKGKKLNALNFPAIKPLFEYATKNNKKLLVIIPQYPKVFGPFSDEDNKLIVKLVKKNINQYNIPHKNVYVTGASYGGKAIYNIVYNNPDLFYKALIVSYINSRIEFLEKFNYIKLYYVYGENEVNKIWKITAQQEYLPHKIDLKYKILKNKNHIETIDEAYEYPEFWDWLFTD